MKQNRKVLSSILPPGLALLLWLALSQTGCGPHQAHDNESHAHDHSHATAEERPVRIAMAELQPTEGNETRGTITFFQEKEGIRVVVDVRGMSGAPGSRGFHIHEHGDCSAPDATSAGGHFNPHGMAHGSPDDDQRHAGDFGNLEFDEEGVAQVEFIDTHITFAGPASIIGRSVIVHAEEDDLETQPTGDAGARVACGVIEVLEYADE